MGKLVAHHLYDIYGVGGDLSWAIGGRSESKLTEAYTELGPNGHQVPIIAT